MTIIKPYLLYICIDIRKNMRYQNLFLKGRINSSKSIKFQRQACNLNLSWLSRARCDCGNIASHRLQRKSSISGFHIFSGLHICFQDFISKFHICFQDFISFRDLIFVSRISYFLGFHICFQDKIFLFEFHICIQYIFVEVWEYLFWSRTKFLVLQ